MTDRLGGALARKPLHFIFVLDVSGSMLRGGRIQALNNAIAESLPHLRDEARVQPARRAARPRPRLRQRAGVDRPRAHSRSTSSSGSGSRRCRRASPSSAARCASSRTSSARWRPPRRPTRPAIILVSDGRPTQSSGTTFAEGLQELLNKKWGEAAVRLALGVGRDADMHALRRFIGNEDVPLLRADNPEQLVEYIVWASKAASQVASRPVLGGTGRPRPRRCRRPRWVTRSGARSGDRARTRGPAEVSDRAGSPSRPAPIGSVHVRDQRPLQDAVATFAEDDVSVIAVADGHGHHLHFRSDVGARLAADGAVAAVRAAAAGWGGSDGRGGRRDCCPTSVAASTRPG